eukprot:TRINITY_DN2230_c0_g1_i4.p2 TRINITY_DN2230_c0_g1~~TRINITY_DN2230_c0_g1_i4.p2  ORF type:complete len:130 (+),score=43.95 TRINITY_DN2230_c0_g1_i4:66-455(+)
MCIRDSINTSDNDWEDQLKKQAKELDAKCCFEAIAGDMTGKVLQNMPNGSVLYVYGALSGKDCSNITPVDLIFKKKKIEGLWLTDYIQSKGMLGLLFFFRELKKHLSTCLLYTSPSPRDRQKSRMPSSA